MSNEKPSYAVLGKRVIDAFVYPVDACLDNEQPRRLDAEFIIEHKPGLKRFGAVQRRDDFVSWANHVAESRVAFPVDDGQVIE